MGLGGVQTIGGMSTAIFHLRCEVLGQDNAEIVGDRTKNLGDIDAV